MNTLLIGTLFGIIDGIILSMIYYKYRIQIHKRCKQIYCWFMTRHDWTIPLAETNSGKVSAYKCCCCDRVKGV